MLNSPKRRGTRPRASSLVLLLAVLVVAWPATRARGADTPWLLNTNLDLAGYDAAIAAHASDGYRPISVSARNTASGARFEVAWANDGVTDWQQIRQVDVTTLTSWVAARRAEGYRLAVLVQYTVPALTCAAVVIKEPGADWLYAVNRTSAQMQSDFTTYAGLGYRPYWITASGSGAGLRLGGIWTRDGLGYATYWNQDAATFAANAADFKNQGGRLLRASGYGTTATPLFAATWVFAQQPDAWSDFLGQSAAQLATTVADMTAQGFRPIDIGAYDVTSGARYNSTWVRQPIPRNWTVTGRDVPALGALDDVAHQFMEQRRAPAVSLSVTYQGRLVYSRAFTYAPDGYPLTTPDSVFRLASVSKPILAVGLLQLVDQGRVHLDDKMVSILGGGWSDPRVANITVRDLLQHSGGWDRGITADPMFYDVPIATALGVPLPISQQNIIDYQKTVMLDHNPGTAYTYSNFGFMLAGRIIEAVTGQSYNDYMREHVFAPLGRDAPRLGDYLGQLPNEVLYSDPQQRRVPSVMDAAQPLVDYCYGSWNQGNVASVGGVVCSTSDLVRFASALDDRDASPLLSRARIDEMFARPAFWPTTATEWYGLGWLVDKQGNATIYASHDGALPGTMSWLSHRPDGINWAFVVNQNSLYTPGMPNNYDIWTAIDPILDSVAEWPAGDLWCVVDLNQDGIVDFGDYLEFLNLFDISDPAVDFNKDGIVDFGDYLEFLNLFDAGC